MVSRETLDRRGVFTSDMQEIQDRLDEVHCILEMVAQRVKLDCPVIAIVLNSAARTQRQITYDLGDIDDVLRERGIIVTPEEAMAKKRAAEAAPPAKVISLVAGKSARRSRKAVR